MGVGKGIHIRDIQALEEFNNAVEYAGEAMATIESNVSSYINGVKDVLEEQLEILRERLEEAKEALETAESELSDCEASQNYDEETREYHPSCSCEERAVERARRTVDECQRKYDAGKRIVDECSAELSDYYANATILRPPGGHYMVEYMANTATPKASELIRQVIDKSKEINEADMGNDGIVPEVITNPHVTENDLPMTEEEKQEAFSQFIDETKDEQSDDLKRKDVRDANRAMRCPECGLPLPLCQCGHRRDNVVIYK